MEKYFCNCLNIIINVNSKETKESVGKTFLFQTGIQDEMGQTIDPFFAGMLLDVKMAISGIELSHSALSRERTYGDWLVNSCLNCGLDTHAVHAAKGADKVLVSKHLPHGTDRLAEIKDSPTYSNIFKINMMEQSNRFKNDATYINQRSIVQVTSTINDGCKKLIQVEEDAKSERIRIFTENEQHQFRQFKMKANMDREALLRTIRMGESSNSLFDPFSETYFTQSESRDKTTELPYIKGPSFNMPGKKKDNSDFSNMGMMSQSLPDGGGGHERRNIRSIKSKSGTSGVEKMSFSVMEKKRMEKKNSSDSDDILFDLEGFHNYKNCEPFYESDDDSSGDATSLESSGGYSGSRSRSISTNSSIMASGDRVYATSLPVAVPLFNNERNSYDPESDEDLKGEPSLSQLALSFKAVAKSMQDSTGMFGELPSRQYAILPNGCNIKK